MATIMVGDVVCDAGEKKFGEISLVEDSLFEVRIPVGVVNGSAEGPVVCIVAGTHACEYVGIDTAVRICHEISPDRIRGSLIVLPVINPVAFRTATPYVNPMDGLNMAFMFTGKKETTTERMCTAILEQAVYQSNVVLDLHGGDLGEIMLPSVMASTTGREDLDATSMNLARAFGTEYIIQHKREEGPSTAAKYSYESTLEARAAEKGIPGIVGEIGENGRSTHEDVDYYFRRVQNVMQYLKMLDGKPDLPDVQKTIGGALRVRTSRGGVFNPSVGVGQFVRAGSMIATVHDLKGDERERITAPLDALVTLLFTKHVVDSGQIVASLSTIIQELPAWRAILDDCRLDLKKIMARD